MSGLLPVFGSVPKGTSVLLVNMSEGQEEEAEEAYWQCYKALAPKSVSH
jgi:hypothetical protein